MGLLVLQQYIYTYRGQQESSTLTVDGKAAEELHTLLVKYSAVYDLQSSTQTSAADTHGGILTVTTWNFVPKA
jgi:hypothetical protein